MNEASPQSTFHGLPLTAEQDRQITSYIQRQRKANQPWDTPELQAMLADMLDPPELSAEESVDVNLSIESESATASHEEPNQLS